ncbi:MAG: type VI secretion system baseplate subunit TssK [Acidobacteriota bacterium]
MSRWPPDSVRWEEGMLLSPQHFQQQDLYRDALLGVHTRLLAPYHWGALTLEVDEEALAAGLVRLVHLQALLPDGLPVEHHDSIDQRLELDLSSSFEALRQAPRTIYLSVAARRTDRSALDGDLARFRAVDGPLVVDLNTGDTEAHVPRLAPRLHLDDRERPHHSWVEMPLLRVAVHNETPVLSRYEPPRLQVARASPLGKVTSRIAQRLHEKANFLSDQLERPAPEDQGPHLLEKRLLLQAVVAPLPRLRALLASDRSHPYALFLALCDVAGRIAIAGRRGVPPEIPYDHHDLLRCFEELARDILATLDEGINEVWQRYRLVWSEESDRPARFYIAMRDEWRGAELVLGVRNAPSGSREKTHAWIERSAIASSEHLPSVLDRRVEGIGRRRQESIEALVPGSDVSLFRLQTTAHSFTGAEAEQLQVLNRDEGLRAHRPSEIVLFVRRPQTGRVEGGDRE